MVAAAILNSVYRS